MGEAIKSADLRFRGVQACEAVAGTDRYASGVIPGATRLDARSEVIPGAARYYALIMCLPS